MLGTLYEKIMNALGRTGSFLRRRYRKLLGWGLLVVLAVEAVAIGFAMKEITKNGIPNDIARDYFALTRYTLNLFLDTPTIDKIESSTNSRYGGFEGQCNGIATDVLLGWRNRPGVSCAFLLPTGGADYSAGMMWSAYDKNGFMVSEKGGQAYTRKKPDGVIRIIMMGDSSLAGFGASPLKSVAAHTQVILNETLSKVEGAPRYQVINAGVGGYNSAQQYLYLTSELIYYQPDIVFFFNGWTESINRHGHFSDARFAYMRKSKKFKPVPFSSLKMKRHREFTAHIEKSYTPKGAAVIFKNAILRSLGSAWDQTGMGYWTWKLEFRKKWKQGWKSITGLFRKSEKRPPPAEAIKTDFDTRVVKVFEENIRRSAMTAKIRGFKGLFVLQPIIGVGGKPLSPKERLWADTNIGKAKITRRKAFYEHARPLMQTLAGDYAEDKSLCFADMSRVLKNVKERAYVDEGHLNSKGHRIVAQAVIAQLIDCGFLPSGDQAK